MFTKIHGATTWPRWYLAMAPDGGGDAGGAAGGGDGGAGDAGKGEDGGSERTFTQAELDRIVGERLAREKAKLPTDYDDLKTKAAKYDELEAASKSDLEKAKEAAEKAGRERDDAVARATDTLKRATVIAEAAKAGAVDPSDVWALVEKDAITVDGNGNVTGADKAVETLKGAKAHLFGGKQTFPSLGQGKRPGSATPSVAAGRELFEASKKK